MAVYDALKNYRDIVRVASTLIENFFNEKISYLKSKNKQFAALRDIEDQIKTQCEYRNLRLLTLIWFV